MAQRKTELVPPAPRIAVDHMGEGKLLSACTESAAIAPIGTIRFQSLQTIFIAFHGMRAATAQATIMKDLWTLVISPATLFE